ncbi:response regulator [Geomonas terrae]|uniref:histidine kinase n=1 Tax=Geomonas terrae TaxID=2562681 RepID=A0A4S1CLN1_9BACT|nr:PAS domain-containing sensor histidine kinase [Geomonas terrae]TGU74677.1 response regulator [Geomonas terrae]
MTIKEKPYPASCGMRERIIAYFSVISLAGSAALILVLVYGSAQLGIEGIYPLKQSEIVRALEDAADLKVESVVTWLASRRAELAVVANSRDFVRTTESALAGGDEPDSADIQSLSQNLRTLKIISPDTYTSVVLVGPAGKVLAASEMDLVGARYRNKAFIAAALAVGAAEHIDIVREGGEPVILIGRKVLVRDRAGKVTGDVAGVVVAEAGPRPSFEALTLLPGTAGAQSIMILVGPRGELLASVPEQSRTQTSRDPLTEKLTGRVLGKSASSQLETLSDGRRFFATYRYLEVGGTGRWGIAVAVDEETAFAPLAATRSRAALFGLAMISGALLFVWWGAGKIASPIRELRRSVAALEGGDFSARTATGHGTAKEIAELGAAFNSMAERIANWHEELERQVAERTRDLEREKENARRYLDVAAVMLLLVDTGGRIAMINRTGAVLLGGTVEELSGMDWCENFVPAEEKREVRQIFDGLVRGEHEFLEFFENRIVTRDKGTRLISWHNILLRDDQGQVQGVLSSGTDITEKRQGDLQRRELERQLLHTQKLESLGVLAGGVAHDFNNLLMVIGGNLELVRHVVEPESPAVKYLDNAYQAAKRAGDLTRQMLAYSGKGGYTLQVVDLNRLVGENVDLMKASVRKGAVLTAQLQPGVPSFEADPGQMQQVIVNLITNALEAVGEGGTVTVSTGVAEVGAAELAISRLDEKPVAGSFIVLEVADNGAGMDRATCDRMFDPFFSTKFTGRGLGLCAVQGIVRGHGGAILVRSETGEGTSVKVLLPAPEQQLIEKSVAAKLAPTTIVERAVAREEAAKSSPGAEAGIPLKVPEEAGEEGTVLIVDDEEMVRLVCRAMVRGLGYPTLIACDGAEAVALFREHAEKIAAVIMDLSMPGMDGITAADELRRIRPGVKIVLSSGYSAAEEARRLSGQKGAQFIQKPYDLESLRKALGALSGGTTAT